MYGVAVDELDTSGENQRHKHTYMTADIAIRKRGGN